MAAVAAATVAERANQADRCPSYSPLKAYNERGRFITGLLCIMLLVKIDGHLSHVVIRPIRLIIKNPLPDGTVFFMRVIRMHQTIVNCPGNIVI